MGAAQTGGVDCALVTEPKRLADIADLVATGNEDQLSYPAFREELVHWLRFNPNPRWKRAMASLAS
jgi:hypothetical protein